MMQTSRRLIPTGVFVCLVAIAAVPLLGQDVALKYRWPKGEALRYRFVVEQATTMSGLPGVGDMTVNNTIVQVHQMTGDVVTPEGLSTVQVTFEQVKLDLTSPMMNVSYDSASTTSDPASAEFGKAAGLLVGESITLGIAPNGTVKTIDGMAKITAKAQALPQAAAGMSLLGGGAAALLSEDSMKGAYQNFANLPDKAAKAGDTWKQDVTIPNPMGAQTISSTFTMKGVEQFNGHEVVHITVAQAIRTAPGAGNGVMTVTIADTTSVGDILFNAKLGRMERFTQNLTLPMTMSMTGPDGSTMSLQASSQMKNTIELIVK